MLRNLPGRVTLVSSMVKRPPPKPAKPVVPPANRCVCVHGHFYQPPRENPWLETVEVQDSAAPWHDWNERITAECYAPNGAARITNHQGEIVRIVNNYARMSFNFGPTLLKWLADRAPRTYRMILDADRASALRYGGHGSAIAQVYNHVIMPLASRRDALTQIRWGIADFQYRFGRRPEGMWLAETAVNRNVLDLLAAEGIKFTILAPHQCARVRPLQQEPQPAASNNGQPSTDNEQRTTSNSTWTPTTNSNATVDPTHPYLVRLDQGRSIAVFFYDAPPSRAIAFEGLLNSGEAFGARPTPPPSPKRSSPTSPPTARATATTTSTARWRWPTPCTGLSRTATPGSPTTASSWKHFRPSGKLRASKTPPGAAR